jgi:uncharacterized damage-inducible protein DinB
MGMNHAFLAELEHESGNTRRVLSVIPADKADWKPHPKSFSLGQLAVHVTEMHGWVAATVQQTELDFATFDYKPAPFTTADEIVARLDRFLVEGKAALAATNDEELGVPWTLRSGEHVMFTMPRAQCLRSMVFNHIIHHRAQLTVYLRLLDVPMPGMYGPSADEKQ